MAGGGGRAEGSKEGSLEIVFSPQSQKWRMEPNI